LLLTSQESTEQERQRAEQERQRAERLAEQLRALGIEPED
jgi:cytochrome c-type biogenesis protein CcmH/NrfF